MTESGSSSAVDKKGVPNCRRRACPDHPNDVVGPIHPKPMPVILAPGDYDAWLSANYAGACSLAKPYPPDAMHIVTG